MVNFTCNTTLEDMRLTSEEPLVGNLTFHEIGQIVAAGTALIAVLLSLFLIWMHALHYTKPYEQRHIIRILFMVPVYATASLLSFWFYWHAIYFDVMRDCYEAFAIASFFALLCHYIAPNLHDQKDYFRSIKPKGWVWPVSWFKKCCGGDRGPWRTPRSGLTWFNVIWFGIYQYCFIRVAMTITAVVTQYFDRYCESSMSPVFSHVWVLILEAAAVTVAMFMVIQFYLQLRHDLAAHSPFLKVLAIKLVIFLSFWQTFLIDILTSERFSIITPSKKLQYPDIAVGIPCLLLTTEMAFFAVLHLFAFSYKPYKSSKHVNSKYPSAGASSSTNDLNELSKRQGGPLGFKAILDAMNPWDLVKAFGRGVRWIFVGRKHRNDMTYKSDANDLPLSQYQNSPNPAAGTGSPYVPNPAINLPIADQFRRSKFGLPLHGSGGGNAGEDEHYGEGGEEGKGLIAHAQPQPQSEIGGGPVSPGYGGEYGGKAKYDSVTGQELSGRYDYQHSPDRRGNLQAGRRDEYGQQAPLRPYPPSPTQQPSQHQLTPQLRPQQPQQALRSPTSPHPGTRMPYGAVGGPGSEIDRDSVRTWPLEQQVPGTVSTGRGKVVERGESRENLREGQAASVLGGALWGEGGRTPPPPPSSRGEEGGMI